MNLRLRIQWQILQVTPEEKTLQPDNAFSKPEKIIVQIEKVLAQEEADFTFLPEPTPEGMALFNDNVGNMLSNQFVPRCRRLYHKIMEHLYPPPAPPPAEKLQLPEVVTAPVGKSEDESKISEKSEKIAGTNAPNGDSSRREKS